MKFIKDNLCFVICMIILVIIVICLGIWGIPKLNKPNDVIENNNKVEDKFKGDEDTSGKAEDKQEPLDEIEYVYTSLDSDKYNNLTTPILINNSIDEDLLKEELTIDSELVKNLYKFIKVDNTIKNSIYTNEVITSSNLDKNFILTKALEEVKQCKYDSSGNLINEEVKFTKEQLKDKVIELYGNDIVEDYEVYISETAYGGWSYDALTNTYLPEGGSGGCSITNTIVDDKPIVKVTKDEEYVYVYNEIYFGISSFGNTWIYADYNDYVNNVLIGKEQSDELPYTRFEGSLDYDNLYKYFKDKYPNIIYTYKHTFKKGENDNYYWVSTEPLNK